MTYTQWKECLDARVDRLTPKAALAFGLSCAERLFPNYLGFVRVNNWGDPDAIRSSLDAGWTYLTSSRLPDQDWIEAGLSGCETAAPDTEVFSVLASPALDSAASAYCILDFLQSKNRRSMAELSRLAMDTVDMHIRQKLWEEHRESIKSPEDMDAFSKMERQAVGRHFLFLREQRHQEETVDLLEGESVDFEEWKSRWRLVPVSSIGVPRLA